MNIRKTGQVLIIFGALGIIISLLVDLLPGAKTGIQSAQIFGIEIATVILLTGIWGSLTETTEKIDIKKWSYDLFNQVLNLPILVWALAGFLITYILFFISPMFLNETHRMHYFITYIPDRFPIGNDMIAVIELAKGWFFQGQSPYNTQFYPPLTYIIFSPLLLINDYPTLFKLFTFLGVGSYIALTFLIPAKIFGKEKISLVLLLFMSGLVSYGLQFELERGQYNIITFLLCILAIYIFHYHPRYRLFAYLLFSVSVQLKLYPAIFIVMLVDDWRNWKSILLRFAGLGIFNFILLFTMGYQIFLEFMGSVSTQLVTPGWGWNGNHSIKAFVGNLAKDGLGILQPNTLAVVQQNTELIANLLLLSVLICIASGILIFHLRRERGMDSYLLLMCTIGALTIPVSNDYTLSFLAAPVALFLCGLPELKGSRNRFVSIVLIASLSFAYSTILIPFKYKPYYMNNAFLPLFVILIITALLNFIRYKTVKASAAIA